MKKFKNAIFILLLILNQNIYSQDSDSLIHLKVIQLENSLDSIKHLSLENERRTETIESKIKSYSDTLENPITISINKSIWDSLANLFAIILSIITLLYVLKADRINSLFGSYRGKKRYQTLQKEIADLTIRLEQVKNEFDELLSTEPDSFIKDGKVEIDRLNEILNRINRSDNFTYPGDIKDDRQPLIYETRNGDEIEYKFNNYVLSRFRGCKMTINSIEKDLNDRIKEARDIRFGENNILG